MEDLACAAIWLAAEFAFAQQVLAGRGRRRRWDRIVEQGPETGLGTVADGRDLVSVGSAFGEKLVLVGIRI